MTKEGVIAKAKTALLLPLSVFAQGQIPVAEMSLAKVYRDVNLVRPMSYWDYNSIEIPWGWDESGGFRDE